MLYFNKFIFSIIPFLVLISFLPANSANVIGEYSTTKSEETYPLITGIKERFSRDAIITVNGARLNALTGSEITPYDRSEDGIVVRVDKGKIFFRIFPEVNIFTLTTPHAIIKTPRIVNTSGSSIEGMLKIDQQGRTVIQLNSGELEVITSEGKRQISPNEVVTIARANNEGKVKGNHYITKDQTGQDDDENGTGLLPAIVTTSVAAGAVTGSVLLSDDNDNSSGDGVGDNPASGITP